MTTIARVIACLLLILPAVVTSAAPVITSVTPNTSPVAGGIHVTIRGNGFSLCIICSPPVPPRVSFGLTPAASVSLIDTQTLDVVTPAHLPGTFSVTVGEFDGMATATDAFTFSGDPTEAFERILLPIYLPPVQGAFGSDFVTDFRAFNLSGDQTLSVFGLGAPMFCYGVIFEPPPFDPLEEPLSIARRDTLECVDRIGDPGRLLWVPAAMADSFAANLRVTDVSRSSKTAGVEIPLARSRDFHTAIALLGVPIDNQGTGFRALLRIYSLEPEPLAVSVTYLGKTVSVQLRPGTDIFDPAYGTFSEFAGAQRATMDILIESTDPARHIWAFATVTNNETQEITIVSPN